MNIDIKKVLKGGITTAIALVALAGVSVASAALTFSGTSITGDSNSVIDATGTISIGTNSATGITIGQSGQTVFFPGNISSANLFTGDATTTNLAIAGLGTSGSPCLTVNAAGNVATTTCGGSGTSYWSATSTGIYYNSTGTVAMGAAVTATKPVFDVTSPAYGAACNGSTDDTAALAAAVSAANAADGIVYIPRISNGTACETSQPLVITNADLWIDGNLKATAAMSAVVQWGSSTSINVQHSIYGKGIIDSNNLASRTISLYNYNHVNVSGITLYNSASVAGIDIGPSGSPSGNYEAYLHNLVIYNPPGSTDTAGAPGVWLDTGSDSDIESLAVVGFDIGIKNSVHNNQPIRDVHVWGFGPDAGWNNISNLPTTCFLDSVGQQRWIGDECDTASATGLEAASYDTVVDNFLYYNNSTWGSNGVVNAILFDQTGPYGTVSDSEFIGTAGHRIGTDISTGGNNFAHLQMFGNQDIAYVVNQNASALSSYTSNFYGTSQFYGAPTMEPGGTAVTGTDYASQSLYFVVSGWNGSAAYNSTLSMYARPVGSGSTNPNIALTLGAGGLGSGSKYYIDISGATSNNLLGNSTVTTLSTNANCSSKTSPAACGSAAAGSFAISAGGGNTSTTVDTTAVTANSQILLTFDSSLGTKLGTTCNTTINQPTVSARTAGASFTVTMANAVSGQNDCISYMIIN